MNRRDSTDLTTQERTADGTTTTTSNALLRSVRFDASSRPPRGRVSLEGLEEEQVVHLVARACHTRGRTGARRWRPSGRARILEPRAQPQSRVGRRLVGEDVGRDAHGGRPEAAAARVMARLPRQRRLEVDRVRHVVAPVAPLHICAPPVAHHLVREAGHHTHPLHSSRRVRLRDGHALGSSSRLSRLSRLSRPSSFSLGRCGVGVRHGLELKLFGARRPRPNSRTDASSMLRPDLADPRVQRGEWRRSPEPLREPHRVTRHESGRVGVARVRCA